MRVGTPKFLTATSDLFEAEGKHYVTLWFEAEYREGEAKLRAVHELSEVRWFHEDDLPEPLFAPFQRLLDGLGLR